ncbi:MAG: hypothetical protein WEB06_03280 [Actinomycetota bacterium]
MPLPAFVRSAYERHVSAAKAALGEERWHEEVQRGRAMTIDEVHQLARSLVR